MTAERSFRRAGSSLRGASRRWLRVLTEWPSKKGGLPKPLATMRHRLRKAQGATASLWPDVRAAFAWVQEAAEILENRAQEAARAVRSRYQALLTRMGAQADAAGGLQGAIEHFLKVTQSYWPGLFHCYDVEGLPRTNNAPRAVLRRGTPSGATYYRAQTGLIHPGGTWSGAGARRHRHLSIGS
jgi:hypothetical protein